jgi:cellulose synthase/poly-beta-1,6-N-acetylglucosamine synthase-like glycosyltransferase
MTTTAMSLVMPWLVSSADKGTFSCCNRRLKSRASSRDPELVVVDKANGGCKSNAVNAGINAASGTLVLIIDADTVLEADALSRAVLPFLEDPVTVAVGGNIGLTNGCRIAQGRIADIALPRSWFARFQIVEYMRSFLLFRLACASQNAVVLISGAFGLFRRDAVIAVGGPASALQHDSRSPSDVQRRLAEGYGIDLESRPHRHASTSATGQSTTSASSAVATAIRWWLASTATLRNDGIVTYSTPGGWLRAVPVSALITPAPLDNQVDRRMLRLSVRRKAHS